MKVLTFLFVILFFSVSFSQVAVMADMSGSPSGDRTKSWSTSKVTLRVGITKDLSATVLGRTSSWNRENSNPKNGPSDAGLIGLFYRLDPTIRFGGGVGLQTRRLQKKEIGWIVSGDLFFGVVDQKNYYFKKQMFGVLHIEKGQWDKQFYVDARAVFPILDFLAFGGKFESDLGFGPHAELKIPLAAEESMKAVYIYGTYFSDRDVRTTVIGVRIAVN